MVVDLVFDVDGLGDCLGCFVVVEDRDCLVEVEWVVWKEGEYVVVDD